MESMVADLTEEDRRAVTASREYFRQGGESLSLEQVATECGSTMDEIRSTRGGALKPRED